MGPKRELARNNKNKKTYNSYLAEDENFPSFAAQLHKLGLELRDITGDGNCLFRALSDQLEGNETHHLDYRKRVCFYMRENKQEFEPFVAALIEDENEAEGGRKSSNKSNKFQDYIKNLEKTGTYADNGCLVAFARLFNVDIHIHQLNMPIWTINAGQGYGLNQLHIAFHNNGMHYSSVRKLGDISNKPTSISFASSKTDKSNSSKKNNNNNNNYKNYEYSEEDDIDFLINNYEPISISDDQAKNNYLSNSVVEKLNNLNGIANETSYEFQLKVDQILDITKCMDLSLIKKKLAENDYDVNLTIADLVKEADLNKSKCDEIIQNMTYDDNNNNDKNDNCDNDCVSKKNSKLKNTKKADKKKEKKQRQEERQKAKVIEQNDNLKQNQQQPQPIENE